MKAGYRPRSSPHTRICSRGVRFQPRSSTRSARSRSPVSTPPRVGALGHHPHRTEVVAVDDGRDLLDVGGARDDELERGTTGGRQRAQGVGAETPRFGDAAVGQLGRHVERGDQAHHVGLGPTVPFVSTSTDHRRSAAASSSGTRRRCWSSGSPPVITTSVDRHLRRAGAARRRPPSPRARRPGRTGSSPTCRGCRTSGSRGCSGPAARTPARWPRNAPSPWNVGPKTSETASVGVVNGSAGTRPTCGASRWTRTATS